VDELLGPDPGGRRLLEEVAARSRLALALLVGDRHHLLNGGGGHSCPPGFDPAADPSD
jgi:hypothetical protein